MNDLASYARQALITPQELSALLAVAGDKIVILDASFMMGANGLSPETVFDQIRIGDARRFDMDVIADHNTPLPHMLPPADEFSEAVGQLGINNNHLVVVYDQTGIAMGACRAWWMFRIFGHDNVCVLDGGLPAWQMAGLPFTTGAPVIPAPQSFKAVFRPELVKSYDQVRQHVDAKDALILDARPPERFAGSSPHPAVGHMPGAKSVPTGSLIDPQTRGMINDDALKTRFDTLPLTQDSPIITTCGSGVTACVIALALFKQGYPNAAVYDGSWSEWSQQELSSPIVKGFE